MLDFMRDLGVDHILHPISTFNISFQAIVPLHLPFHIILLSSPSPTLLLTPVDRPLRRTRITLSTLIPLAFTLDILQRHNVSIDFTPQTLVIPMSLPPDMDPYPITRQPPNPIRLQRRTPLTRPRVSRIRTPVLLGVAGEEDVECRDAGADYTYAYFCDSGFRSQFNSIF